MDFARDSTKDESADRNAAEYGGQPPNGFLEVNAAVNSVHQEQQK